MFGTSKNIKTKRPSGFTLLEVSIVLLIVGLVLGIGLSSTVAYREIEQQRQTTAKLAGIDAAMISYVARNRRLPCPADGSLASGAALAGTEQRDAAGDCVAGAVLNGVVPWITLGLTEVDATDGWNNRITYRVPSGIPGLTRNASVDMSMCDPAGGAAVFGAGPPVCNPGCTLATLAANCTSPANYLVGRGLRIDNGAGVALMDPTVGNGAAYILISHGPTAAGAFNAAGALLPGTVASGASELQNQNARAIQATYFDAPVIELAGATHFDDIVSRPALATVINKAQLGPRARLL